MYSNIRHSCLMIIFLMLLAGCSYPSSDSGSNGVRKKPSINQSAVVDESHLEATTSVVGSSPISTLWFQPSHYTADIGETPIQLCITDEAGTDNWSAIEEISSRATLQKQDGTVVATTVSIISNTLDGTMSEYCATLTSDARLSEGWYYIVLDPRDTAEMSHKTNLVEEDSRLVSWFHVGNAFFVSNIKLINKTPDISIVQVELSELVSIRDSIGKVEVINRADDTICQPFDVEQYRQMLASSDLPTVLSALDIVEANDLQHELRYICTANAENGFSVNIANTLTSGRGVIIGSRPDNAIVAGALISIERSQLENIAMTKVYKP